VVLLQCYKLLKKILSNPADRTNISLIFANHTEEDIILRNQLDDLASTHKNFKVHYVLSRPSNNWSGDSGFVSRKIVQSYIAPPSDSVLVYICGPPKFVETVSGPLGEKGVQGELSGILKELGYNKDIVFKF